MDLSMLDPGTLEARGKYSTLNSEQKRLMELMQSQTQTLCDQLRKGLSEITGNDSEIAVERFDMCEQYLDDIRDEARQVNDLLVQKRELYPTAWGKK